VRLRRSRRCSLRCLTLQGPRRGSGLRHANLRDSARRTSRPPQLQPRTLPREPM
jgi:hypothetical protein